MAFHISEKVHPKDRLKAVFGLPFRTLMVVHSTGHNGIGPVMQARRAKAIKKFKETQPL